MNIPIAVDRELFAVTARVVVLDGDDKICATGTAFLIAREERRFLVTARHLVENAARIVVYLQPVSRGAFVDKQIEVEVRTDDLTFHPRSEADLAVVPFDRYRAGMQSARILVWPWRSIATALDEENLGIEDVVYVGYPYGWSGRSAGEDSPLPIARRALIATPPDLDFGGQPTFLIDGHVAQGSSGSPLFVMNRAEGALLLGVVIQSLAAPSRVVDAPLAQLQPLIDLLQEPAGLGVVVKASALSECIVASRESTR